MSNIFRLTPDVGPQWRWPDGLTTVRDGQVIQHVEILGTLVVAHSDVTIRNCILDRNAPIIHFVDGVTGCVVIGCRN